MLNAATASTSWFCPAERRSVSKNNNHKALVFLYHNQRLIVGAFEMVEVQEDFEEDMEDIEDLSSLRKLDVRLNKCT